jgi:hypothetical protein
MRALALYLASALFTTATLPAAACDPDALWKEVQATCTDFVLAANAPAARVWPHLDAGERGLVEGLTREAMAGCGDVTFAAPATSAARLALTLGRLEAKYGLPLEQQAAIITPVK